MTNVPDDPASAPPANTSSRDPSVAVPAEQGDGPEQSEEELEKGREAALETELPPDREGVDETARDDADVQTDTDES